MKMIIIIMVIMIMVLTTTLVTGLTYTTESTFTASASPNRFSDINISVTNSTLEKYFNITKDRINDTTWKLTISIGEELLTELRMCYNNITSMSYYPEGYYCNITELKTKHLKGHNVTDANVTNFINKSRNMPINKTAGNGYSNINTTNYLDGSFTVLLTFNTFGTNISIGLGTIYTFLASTNGNIAYDSAFDELSLDQDSVTAITICDATCLNQTNTSNNVNYTTTGGDQQDDAYFAVNWTVSGNNVNWAFVTMEGHEEDGINRELAIWNWTSSTWINVNTTTGTANVDSTLRFNITNSLLLSYDSNGRIRTVFYTSNKDSNTLEIDYVGLLVSYNASINFTTPSINDTEVFIGESVNHSVVVQTGTGSTLSTYIFSWNATGINCDTWANSSVISTSGTTANISNVSVIPSACADKNIGYKFYVNNSDRIWNASTTGNYTVYAPDTTPPTVNINLTLDETYTTNTTLGVNFNFTDAGSNTANCTLYFDDSPVVSNATTQNKTNTVLAPSSPQSAGNHSVFVNCTDGNNNVGNSSIIHILVDNAAPSVNALVPVTGNWTNNSQPNFYFNFSDTVSPNASCVLFVGETRYGINGSVVNDTLSNLTANASITGGSYSWNITCTDRAGNSGGSAARTITIDDVAPTVNALVPVTGNWTNVAQPNFFFNFTDSVSPNASCTLFIGATMYGTNSSNVNNTLSNITANASVSAGSYSWNVTCTDLAGNSAGSTARTINVDVTAPSVNAILPATGNVTNINTPNFFFNYSDSLSPNASCVLYVGSVNRGSNFSVVNYTQTNITASTIDDGSYSWNVTCTDLAGNGGGSAARTITVDATAPSVNAISPVTGNFTSNVQPNFFFNFTDSVSPNASCTLFIGATMYGTNSSNVNNTLSNITANASIPVGSYSWNVTCTDSASNSDGSIARTIAIDTAAPSVNALVPVTGNWTNLNTPNFYFNYSDVLSPNASCVLFVGASNKGSNASTQNNTLSNITASTIDDGSYSWNVTCTDLAGNSAGSTARTIAIDTAAPTVNAILPASGNWTNVNTPNFFFNYSDSLSPNASCVLYVGASNMGSNSSVVNFTLSNITASTITGGAYSWNVTCTDLAGNSAGSIARTITVDATAPSVNALVPATGNWTNNPQPNFFFNFTDSVSSAANCTLFVGTTMYGTNFSVVNNTLSNISANASIPDGSYSWNVTCTDSASNSAGSIARTIAIDTAAPSVNAILPATGNATNINTPNFFFNYSDSLSPNASCILYVGSVNRGSNSSVVNYTRTNITASTISDGAYNWNVTCTDLAGNRGGSADRTITVDASAPSVNALIPVTGNWTNNSQPNFYFNFTDALSSTASCVLFVGTTRYGMNSSAVNNTLSNITANASIPVGSYSWNVTCTDPGGNSGGSAARTITIDTAAPTVNAISPATGNWTSNAQPNFYFNYSDTFSSTASCVLFVGTTQYGMNGSVVNNTLSNITANASITNGSYSWNVTCTDLAGNSAGSIARTVNVDTGAPTVNALIPATGNWTSNAQPNFYFNYSDTFSSTASCVLFVGTTRYGINSSTVNNTLSNITANASITAGSYSWNITCTDLAGNNAGSIARTINVDTGVPTVNALIPDTGNWTNVNTPNFYFNYSDVLSPNASCVLFVGTTQYGMNGSVVNDTLSNITANASITNGSYSWNVTCTDLAGNSAGSIARTVNVDTGAPTVNALIPATGNSTNINTPNFFFNYSDSLSPNASCILYVGASNKGSNSSVVNNTLSNITASTITDGAYNWNVTCTDLAGNRGGSADRTITVDAAAPTVNALIPATGNWTNNAQPNFYFNFTDSISSTVSCVLFVGTTRYGMNSSTVNNTLSNITANASITAGSYSWNVTCTDPGGNSAGSIARTITIDNAAPSVNALIPATGNATNINTPNFFFNYSDSLSPNASCILYVGSVNRGSNSSVVNYTQTNITASTISDGAYNWNVTCTDLAGNRGGSADRTITVDIVAPSVSPSSPDDNAWTTVTTPGFIFTANDSLDGFLNCTLWVDSVSQISNASTINNTQTTLTPSSALSEASHSWNVTCIDNATNAGANTARTLYVDNTIPTVNINTSQNNTIFTTSTPTISFNFTDSVSNAANCTLYFGGVARNYTPSVGNASQTLMTVNTSLSDANYSVYINCTDKAGKIGKSGVLNIEIDTIAPAISAVVNWSINGSAARVNWSTAEESNGSVKYGTDTGLTTGGGTVTHTSFLTSHSLNLTGLSATTIYYYNVTSCDAHGNCNISGLYNFTTTTGPDATAPTVNINTTLDELFTSDTTPDVNFNFTDSESTTANCSLYFNSISVANNASTQNKTNTVLTSSVQSAGNHSVFVNCTDGNNNVGNSSIIHILVDNAAPSVNALVPVSGNWTNNAQPNFFFNFSDIVSPNASCVLFVGSTRYGMNGSVVNNTLSNITANASITSGTYSWNITCTDRAGNSAGSAARTITVDTTAPTVNALIPVTGNWTNVNTPNFYFNYSDVLSPNASCILYVGASNVGSNASTQNNTLTNITASTISDGAYSWNVTCTDLAGNRGGSADRTITVDATAPSVNALVPVSGNWTNNAQPNFFFNFSDSMSPNASCTLFIGAAMYGTNSSNVNNTLSNITANASITAGSYSWNITCTDRAGNSGGSAARTINVDTTAPAISINTSLNNTATTDTTPTIDFNFSDSMSRNASCTLYFNSSQDTNTSVINNTVTYLTPTSAVAEGRYDVWVNCTDLAGNIGKSPVLNMSIASTATYVIINVSAGMKFRLASSPTIDVTQQGQSGVINVLAGANETSGSFAALIVFNFTQDIDVTNLTLNTSQSLRKSVIYNSSSVPGMINKSLLIPKVVNSNKVYICPDAQNLDQVNTSCPNLVNISTDETVNGMTVSTTTYQGENYYLVSNITGTGGGEPDAGTPLQCFFIQNTTCPIGLARLAGVKNDTEGYNNAHAQNNSYETYNYSICCNSTNASITITSSCPGQEDVIKLSNSTNAHVELGNLTTYSVLACLSSDWKKVSCYYPTGSCDTGYACLFTIAGSEGDNSTNAHIGDCSQYSTRACCALANNAPPAPTLYNPNDDNTTVFERKINFNWSTSTDPDGDSVDYLLNVTCGGCTAGCYEPFVSDITTTNYTSPTALCVDTDYNWTVTACDTYDLCNTSTMFSFQILSTADLILIINATSFGTMALGQNADTTDDTPTPLVTRNIGNVLLNVTINATPLFSTVSMNTEYYQFKADENESGSYAQSCSQHASFANMDNATVKTIFCNISYEDANDEGEVEINLTVPISESPGAKSSQMELIYVQSE